MHQRIKEHLQRIAAEKNIQILYACETGSRGWGFASPDSDYDVRFVYVYPQAQYLTLYQPEEQLGSIFEDDGEVLDFNAWELRKMLRHLRQSNATPFEWLQSPIVYQEIIGFRDEIWALCPQYFSARVSIFHYLGICQRSALAGIEGDTINIKKYFYILRPLLAAMWAADHGTIPPMTFEDLLVQVKDNQVVWAAIQSLLKQKEQAKEAVRIPLVPELQLFIESQTARCRQIAEGLPKTSGDSNDLDLFFQKWLR